MNAKFITRIGFKLMVLATFIIHFGCATYYDYKFVKNINIKKRKKAFRYDSKKCRYSAAREARSPDAFILTDSGIDSRPTLYKKCMKRKGWRLRK